MSSRVVTASGVYPAAPLVERFGLMPELTGVSPAAPLFESIRLTPDPLCGCRAATASFGMPSRVVTASGVSPAAPLVETNILPDGT